MNAQSFAGSRFAACSTGRGTLVNLQCSTVPPLFREHMEQGQSVLLFHEATSPVGGSSWNTMRSVEQGGRVELCEKSQTNRTLADLQNSARTAPAW